jgi:hypothetical protein
MAVTTPLSVSAAQCRAARQRKGLALAARGDLEAALAAYRETLGFLPTHADALRG